MKIRCPKCNVGIGIKPKHLGRTIACPKCQSKFKIPDRDQDDVPVVYPIEELSPATTAPEVANDPFADPFAIPQDAPLVGGLPPANYGVTHTPAKRKKKSINWQLWGILGAGLLGLLLFVAVAIPFVSGFLEAIQPRTYNFQPQQTYTYDAKMSVPHSVHGVYGGNTWNATIDYTASNDGKISWTTKMKNFGGSSTARATFSPDSETGSFDLPASGFGGLSHANKTHMFPFFIGPAATVPIIPLSPGSNWKFTQNVSLPVDQPIFGLQPGDQLKAVLTSQFEVKFEQRNQTVILEDRVIETTDGNKLLQLAGQHTYDDRVGIISSDFSGTFFLGSNEQVPFKFKLEKVSR